MKHLTLAIALLCALASAGCASAKPEVKCNMKHEAEVFQGIVGIGVGQRLAEADALCVQAAAPASGATR